MFAALWQAQCSIIYVVSNEDTGCIIITESFCFSMTIPRLTLTDPKFHFPMLYATRNWKLFLRLPVIHSFFRKVTAKGASSKRKILKCVLRINISVLQNCYFPRCITNTVNPYFFMHNCIQPDDELLNVETCCSNTHTLISANC